MSAGEPFEVVRQAIDAINRRDVEGYLELCTPDIELYTPVSALEGPYVGEQGVCQFFAMIEESTREFELDLVELRPIDTTRALARGMLRGRSGGGVAMESPFANIYELEAGRLRRVRIYLDVAEGLAAAGFDR